MGQSPFILVVGVGRLVRRFALISGLAVWPNAVKHFHPRYDRTGNNCGSWARQGSVKPEPWRVQLRKVRQLFSARSFNMNHKPFDRRFTIIRHGKRVKN